MLWRYATLLLLDVSHWDDNEKQEIENVFFFFSKKGMEMLKNQLALLWLENEEHFQMQSIVRKTTKTKYMGIYNLDKISTLFKSMPCIKANLSVLH